MQPCKENKETFFGKDNFGECEEAEIDGKVFLSANAFRNINEEHNLDFGNCLPKFLIQDLNNIKLEDEEDTTRNTDVFEPIYEDDEIKEPCYKSNTPHLKFEHSNDSFHAPRINKALKSKYNSSEDLSRFSRGFNANYGNGPSYMNFNIIYNNNSTKMNGMNPMSSMSNMNVMGSFNSMNGINQQNAGNYSNQYMYVPQSDEMMFGNAYGDNHDNGHNIYNCSNANYNKNINIINNVKNGNNFGPNFNNERNLINGNLIPQSNSYSNLYNCFPSNLPTCNNNNNGFRMLNPKRIVSSENVMMKSSNMNKKPFNFVRNQVKSNSNKSIKHLSKPGKGADKEDFDSLEEMLSHLTTDLSSFVKTQKGSRTLQKLLDVISPDQLDIILENLKGDFCYLMTDTYGNYLCQKVIQCCTAEQRVFILRHIKEVFTEIACNPSGTHSLQSLIEILNMKEEEQIIKECVIDSIIKLSLDNNGTHVMQKIVSCLNENNRDYINTVILANFNRLVLDSNGICVLKKFVNGTESPQLRRSFISKVVNNALEIIQNPFGNYVVQHVFDEWGMQCCTDILNVIVTNVLSLSMQKFSSNVVEKCLEMSDMNSRRKIIKEIFNPAKISSMIKNKYGNYVLQKAISTLLPEEKKEIKEELTKKVSVTSNKEKGRLSSLIDIL